MNQFICKVRQLVKICRSPNFFSNATVPLTNTAKQRESGKPKKNLKSLKRKVTPNVWFDRIQADLGMGGASILYTLFCTT